MPSLKSLRAALALAVALLLAACGGESEELAAAPPDVTPEKIWRTAERIGGNGAGDAESPQVAFDGDGNALVVWSESDGVRKNIWSRRYAAGSGWQVPQLLEADNAGPALRPQIAMDAAGGALAVWHQFDGSRNNIMASRFSKNGGWQPPELVDTATENATDAQVGVDSAGNAIVVWRQSDGTLWNAWSRRYSVSTGWGTAVLLEELDTDDAVFPRVAVHGDGSAFAYWAQNDGVETRIWARQFVPGAGWQAVQYVSADNVGGAASFPQVKFDSAGNALAVWSHSNGVRFDIWSNRFVAGGSWQVAELRESNDSGNAITPTLAADGASGFMVLWSQHDGTYFKLWATRYASGSGWQAPIQIDAEDAGNVGSAAIASRHGGDAMAVWSKFDGTRFNIWSNRYAVGLGWQTPTLLETANAGHATLPQIATDHVGNAIAVWQQFDGSFFHIWANGFN